MLSSDATESPVVVPVVGIVPVAIGAAQVDCFIVPGTAAQHTAMLTYPFESTKLLKISCFKL